MLDTMTRETNAAFVGSSEDINEIPIWHKFNLTIEEAARYSNIGVNKIREIVFVSRLYICFARWKKKTN